MLNFSRLIGSYFCQNFLSFLFFSPITDIIIKDFVLLKLVPNQYSSDCWTDLSPFILQQFHLKPNSLLVAHCLLGSHASGDVPHSPPAGRIFAIGTVYLQMCYKRCSIDKGLGPCGKSESLVLPIFNFTVPQSESRLFQRPSVFYISLIYLSGGMKMPQKHIPKIIILDFWFPKNYISQFFCSPFSRITNINIGAGFFFRL